jgi:hypothetical protein
MLPKSGIFQVGRLIEFIDRPTAVHSMNFDMRAHALRYHSEWCDYGVRAESTPLVDEIAISADDPHDTRSKRTMADGRRMTSRIRGSTCRNTANYGQSAWH